MLIKDQDQRLKRKILKNISKKKKYKNYNIEYFVNWTFEKLSNSQFEEILDNMTSLLPSEYLTKAILKDVEEISFLESLGVGDSKKIDDSKILKIAPEIAKRIKYKSRKIFIERINDACI